MSNPSINRWGLNLFWYNFWFNDKNNSLIIQQNFIINKFIYLYLYFGLLNNTNIFIKKYWYKNFNINFNKILNDFNFKYFRFIEYKSKVFNEYKICKMRNKVKNVYFSKLWILKFQNWLILNFYSYKPIIKRIKRISFRRKKKKKN